MKKTFFILSIIFLPFMMWGSIYFDQPEENAIQVSVASQDVLIDQGNMRSLSNQGLFANQTEMPVEETEVLAEETEMPAEETEMPVEETEMPVEETEVPTEEVEKSVIRANSAQEALQKSRNAEKNSINLFNEGFYTESIAQSEEAEAYALLAKNWFRANGLLKRAEEKLVLAIRYKVKENNADLYNEANSKYMLAQEQYKAFEFDASIENSLAVADLLKDIKPGATGKTYTVQDKVPADCFWNIAAYPEIYGDPTKWQIIYEANKEKLHQPNNPDLIHPGMIFDIPPLD